MNYTRGYRWPRAAPTEPFGPAVSAVQKEAAVAEDLLRRLLDHFANTGGDLTWSYKGDTLLSEVDPDLARDLDAWRSSHP